MDEARIVIGPNASMTAQQAWLFMGFMSAVGLVIALFLAVNGLWLVLPFTGLELSALGAALYVAIRRNAYREVLVFSEEILRIEFGEAGRGPSTTVEAPRSLTRVIVEQGDTRHAPTRLILSTSGQRVQIARCLTDEERERLARRIKQLLTPAWYGAQASPARGSDSECHWET